MIFVGFCCRCFGFCMLGINAVGQIYFTLLFGGFVLGYPRFLIATWVLVGLRWLRVVWELFGVLF